MKLTKKLAAGLLAAAMMLTMAAPAFATSGNPLGENKVEKDEISFTKKITDGSGTDVTGTAVPTDFTVEFTVSNANATHPASVQSAPAIGTNNKISGTVGTDGTVSLKFSLPKYDKPGVYKYTIAEEDPKVAGVTASNQKYIIEVRAKAGSNASTTSNDIKCDVVLYDTTDSQTKLAEINNVYKAGTLTVEKEVKGDQSDYTDEFYIQVVLSSTKQVKSVAKLGDENIAVSEWTKAEGSDAWTVTKVVTLKNSDVATFTNLPDGVTYTVKELTEDQKNVHSSNTVTYNYIEYTVTGEVTDATAIEGGKASSATVTNTTESLKVETGVILDNAPYIVMAGIVIAGIVVLAVVRRRREE